MWKPQSNKHSNNSPISRNEEESRQYLFCLLLQRPYFSLHRHKKKTSQSSAMSPVTQYINVLAITIPFFSKKAGVWKAFSHSFLWRHFQLWFCYCSSICAARETIFTPFKSLSALLLFSFSAFSAYI